MEPENQNTLRVKNSWVGRKRQFEHIPTIQARAKGLGSDMSLVGMLVFESFTLKGGVSGQAQELSPGHEIIPHFRKKQSFSCINLLIINHQFLLPYDPKHMHFNLLSRCTGLANEL